MMTKKQLANDLVHMSSRTLLTPYPYFTKNMPTHAFTPLDLLPSKSYFSNTFFPRSVQEWNKLPQNTATAPSWEAFKASRLEDELANSLYSLKLEFLVLLQLDKVNRLSLLMLSIS